MPQHRRVVSGISYSSYLLRATFEYHIKIVPEHLKNTPSEFLESVHVENRVTSVDSNEQLSRFIDVLKTLLSNGNVGGNAVFEMC